MVRAFAPYHPEENITHGGSYIIREVHDKIEHIQYAEKYKIHEFHCLPPFRQRQMNKNIANAKFSHIPKDNEPIRIYIRSAKKLFPLDSTMYFIST